MLNNGKPIVYPELPRFLGLMQRITSEAAKVDPTTFAFSPRATRGDYAGRVPARAVDGPTGIREEHRHAM